MDTPNYLTTGQAAGLTQLSTMRLYHYVKDYPEYFSPQATKHTRGRRWTPEDIEIILSIKALHRERLGKANIRELLADGWRLKKDSFFSREALDQLYEISQIYYADAQKVQQEAKRLAAEVKVSLKSIHQDHDSVVKMRGELSDIENQFHQLVAEVRTKRYSIFGPKPTH